MNINPIKAKLQKMFGKNRKNKASQLSMPSTIHESRISSQLNSSLMSIPQSMIISPYCHTHTDQFDQNSQYSTQNKENRQNSNNFMLAIQELKHMKTQLNHYKSLSKKLEQKLQDHQLLEQFYLLQLKERNQVEKQLKWKLNVIGEEIKNKRITLGTVDGGSRGKGVGEKREKQGERSEGEERGFSLGY